MRTAIIIALCVIMSLVFAQDLQKKHEAAMQANGFMLERDGKFQMQGNVSVYLGSDMGTGYMEEGDKKIFYEVYPIEGGVKIVIKITILGKTFEKTVIIKFNNGEANIAVENGDRYDWMCILKCAGSAAFSCISCMTNWVCWATCAGPNVVSCVMGCF